MDISVITSVHNSEKYIKDCVESVQRQTLPYNLTLEHLIVDDGSTDGTKTIINQLQKKYTNIKYFNYGKIGRAKALNKAVDNSKGTFIANIDSDDVFLTNKLYMQYRFMLLHEDCDLLTTNFITFNDEIPLRSKEKTTYERIDHGLLKKNTITHSSVLFRQQQLLEIGKYDEKRNSQIDLELWLRYLYYGMNVYNLDSILTGKRIHANQSFEKKDRVRYLTVGSKLKLEYIFKMSKYQYIPAVGVRFLAGLLPENFRKKFRT
ncbi:glycosyltransferase family 2 protein [Tetragenococcus koreensis]|uniref:glycosyltransferase family 2 protein n=1 Tax=Tetragenococcus koreensis TaxID=290335 RepID=UPI000F4FF228|nr:glycosyltransferase family A protein [Tetragenococcus koreensis]AYW46467.1 hypothetical protein C7K43_11360 [Tetragenococcus koreensis]GEN92000.1 hypothetical protein TKO01_20460 [Tetragenococcus koreensis]